MASPHVAGVAAQILQTITDPSPASVTSVLLAAATPNLVVGAGTGSPNRLLYSDATSSYTPPPPPQLVLVSIGALSSSALKIRNGWTATVTVKVRKSDGSAAAGAVVKGDYSVGGKGLVCTTDTNGVCSIKSGAISKNTVSVNWAITDIGGTGFQYSASGNAVSSISVARPQ